MRKLRNKRFHFNMIEIVLAIAILAFGFASILGLFPVAIKTVKATQTESVVSDAVEDLSVYFRTMARVPLMDIATNVQLEDEYWYALLFYKRGAVPSGDFTATSLAPSIDIDTKYGDYYNGTKQLVFYDETSLDARRTYLLGSPTDGQDFLNDLKTAIKGFAPTEVVREELAGLAGYNLLPNLNLFQPDLQTTNYYLLRGDERFDKIDLSAQIILWKSKMQQVYLKGGAAYDSTGLDYRHGVVLNIEISWPLHVPYGEREKRYYQFTIANPKKR